MISHLCCLLYFDKTCDLNKHMKEEISHMYDCVQMTQIEKGQKEGIKKEINIEGKNRGKTINNIRVMNHLIYSFFFQTMQVWKHSHHHCNNKVRMFFLVWEANIPTVI